MKKFVIELSNLYLLSHALECMIRQYCSQFVDSAHAEILLRALIVKHHPDKAGTDADNIMLQTIAKSIPGERNCVIFTKEDGGITMKSGVKEEFNGEEYISFPEVPAFETNEYNQYEVQLDKTIEEFFA